MKYLTDILSYLRKPKEIEYHALSDETIGIHTSSFLPRPGNINPLGHKTVDEMITLSKQGNDELGRKPKKGLPLWATIMIVVVAVLIVGYLMYDDMAKKGYFGTPPTPPAQQPLAQGSPSGGGVEIIPLPGLG